MLLSFLLGCRFVFGDDEIEVDWWLLIGFLGLWV